MRLLARSDASAWRAEENAQGEARKLDGGAPERIKVTTNAGRPRRLRPDRRGDRRGRRRRRRELLATLRRRGAGGRPGDDDLVALDRRARGARRAARSASSASTSSTRSRGWSWSSSACPRRSRPGSRDRARAWCAALGKTAIEVPDQAGFVVNRLLFPYLFEAVRLMESSGMAAADVDSCMQLGRRAPDGAAAAARFRRPRRRRGDRREPRSRRRRRRRRRGPEADSRDGRRGQARPEVGRGVLRVR